MSLNRLFLKGSDIMAKLLYDSYEQGFYDCQMELSGKSELTPDYDFTPPDEDEGELDVIQYVRGQIAALIKHLNLKS